MPKNQVQVTIEKTNNGYIISRTTDSGTVRDVFTSKGTKPTSPSATNLYEKVIASVETDLS